jgi:hypothetical protein
MAVEKLIWGGSLLKRLIAHNLDGSRARLGRDPSFDRYSLGACR